MSASGQTSFIDHVISKGENSMVKNVNIMVSEDEWKDLEKRNGANYMGIHKNCWEYINLGDHRPIMVEVTAIQEKKTESEKRPNKID